MIAFLDTGPTGGITSPNPKSDEAERIKVRARDMEQAGHSFVVPAIVDYELRREHHRRNAVKSSAALDNFLTNTPNRYLDLTDTALKRAALLWAELRQRGLPTADAKSLDCVLIFVAQILDLELPSGSFVVVTDNVGHLSRVIACERWQHIVP